MDERRRLRGSVRMTLSFVSLIWVIKIMEFAFDLDFSEFGILPRTLNGSIGIITGPLIHGDIFHLLSNTFPVLILGMGILYFYHGIAPAVLTMIYLMTGFWVWIAAREAYHIGASGLVYGMLTFLLLSGFMRKDRNTLALSFVILFLYGGSFFAGIVPEESHISWESHLMGAIAGIFCAIYFKGYRLSPKPQHVRAKDEGNTFARYHYTYVDGKAGENAPKKYINVIDLDKLDQG